MSGELGSARRRRSRRCCQQCGAPVGFLDRGLCHRCWRRHRAEAAKQPCPACGQRRLLRPQTGRCATCTKRCVDCSGPVRPRVRIRCQHCHRRHERQAATRLCPRCGRLGRLRTETGWCPTCSRPRPACLPPRPCRACGQVRRHAAFGLCGRCWQRHPDRPFAQAERLAARLDDPPAWLGAFVAYAAARHCVGRTTRMVTALGRLLTDGAPTSPQALLERARRPGRSAGTLARTLEGFFVADGLAFGLYQQARLAHARRQRRIDAVPQPLRAAVARFAETRVHAQQRARRAGTRPRADRTIEASLAVVRDLACFLVAERTKHDWATVDAGDLEAFLARLPASRARRLGVLRRFFGWARAHRLVLVDPTATLTAGRQRGFSGQVLTIAEQRRLYRRWTSDPQTHPHECLVGLFALLHGAAGAELRGLRIADLDPARRTVRLGRRPHPVPLDPASWLALERCLALRAELGTHNPHLLVTRVTKTGTAPASEAYLAHVLDPAGVPPRRLRATRLADLVVTLDPKLVAEAFGLDPDGVLAYLADHVQEARLPNLPAATPAELAEHPGGAR